MTQSAPIAVKSAKFLSDPILVGQFTAEIVGQREGNREVVDIRFIAGSSSRQVIKTYLSRIEFLIFFSHKFKIFFIIRYVSNSSRLIHK